MVEQSAAGAALRDVDMPVDIPATGCANAVTLLMSMREGRFG